MYGRKDQEADFSPLIYTKLMVLPLICNKL